MDSSTLREPILGLPGAKILKMASRVTSMSHFELGVQLFGQQREWKALEKKILKFPSVRNFFGHSTETRITPGKLKACVLFWMLMIFES